MQLQVILAFALLLWWPDSRPFAPVLTAGSAALLFVLGKLPLYYVVAWLIGRTALRRLEHDPRDAQRVLAWYHRCGFLMRIGILAGTAADLMITTWPELVRGVRWLQAVPGLDRLSLVAPYVLGLALTWWALYPVERAGREAFAHGRRWTRRQFLMFNLRHQVLIVALPLAFIVAAFDAAQEHRRQLVQSVGSPWAPEVLVGAVAVLVFVLAPVMLRYIWTTSPLPDGPLRRKLLALCDGIGLRVREILVWHSDGVMVNAAVLGVLPRVRYILLSDALLEAMTDEEIEAVFGHEAGHVRYHHIPYFLIFAVVSMLAVSGLMERLICWSAPGRGRLHLSFETIQMIGAASVVPIWGVAFGWLSRRFERQADTYGAHCATLGDGRRGCRAPCSVHDAGSAAPPDAVCADGARTFIRALRKVAVLNGIPPAERSWRHSSIAARIRFLTTLAGDPLVARGFARWVRAIKIVLLVSCAGGLAFSAGYIWRHPVYHQDVIRNVVEPLRRLCP